MIEDLAKRILIDNLVDPEIAIASGDWLTISDDGSKVWTIGRSFQADSVKDGAVYLKINGHAVPFNPENLHFPLDPQVRTEKQQATLEALYNARLNLFILATASGFIGCRGIIGEPETYEELSLVYPGSFYYRCSVTDAAEDFKAISNRQTQFSVVIGAMPEAVQLVAIPGSEPRWIVANSAQAEIGCNHR